MTVPEAPVDDHVPSPRQNVELEADVPEFRLVTGRFPVTPFDRSICAQAGLLEVPVLERYLVDEVFLASANNVLLADE